MHEEWEMNTPYGMKMVDNGALVTTNDDETWEELGCASTFDALADAEEAGTEQIGAGEGVGKEKVEVASTVEGNLAEREEDITTLCDELEAFLDAFTTRRGGVLGDVAGVEGGGGVEASSGVSPLPNQPPFSGVSDSPADSEQANHPTLPELSGEDSGRATSGRPYGWVQSNGSTEGGVEALPGESSSPDHPPFPGTEANQPPFSGVSDSPADSEGENGSTLPDVAAFPGVSPSPDASPCSNQALLLPAPVPLPTSLPEADRRVELALLQRALGYTYAETVTEETERTGLKTKVTIKQVAPDLAAQIFWLKNRRPERWREKQREEPPQAQEVRVSFQEPGESLAG